MNGTVTCTPLESYTETDPVFYDWYWNTFLPHITIDASTSTVGIMDILPTATLDVGGTKTDAAGVHDTQLLGGLLAVGA